jgi:3-oxoadipate enol-lactonase
MPFATNNGLRLYWNEQGSGTPVLLVMGATYSSRMWYPVIDTLATRHRVIWFDNRGIGRSEASRSGTIEDMASDAVAVLDAAGVDRAHIYGVSLGGVVTLQVALQSPERVRSLVLGCTGILSDEKPRSPRALNILAYIPAKTRRRIFGRRSREGYGSAASESAVEKDLATIEADHASSTGIAQQQNALRAYSVEKEAVGGLDFPALVLHGTEDRAVAFAVGQELAETLPRSRFVTFEGAGHNYLVSYPERANQEVMDFLSDAERSDLDKTVVDA